jgi:hypothetical protein
MPFELLENVSAAPAAPRVPDDGIRFTARQVGKRDGSGSTSYLRLQIGKALAKELAIVGEDTALALAFGSGSDMGKMRLGVDFSAGTFPAKRDRSGCYGLSINARTAEGLFALDFAPVTVTGIKVSVAAGKAPWAVFDLPEAILADD